MRCFWKGTLSHASRAMERDGFAYGEAAVGRRGIVRFAWRHPTHRKTPSPFQGEVGWGLGRSASTALSVVNSTAASGIPGNWPTRFPGRAFPILPLKRKGRFCTGLFLLAIAFTHPAAAQQISKPVLPEDVVNTVVDANTKLYWGKARGPDSTVIEAPDDRAAAEPPIERQEAYRIIDNAAPSGAAAFCRIDWKPYREAYLTLEKQQHQWSDAQMVYVGMLFNSTLDLVNASLSNGYECDDAMHEKAAQKLTASEEFVQQELNTAHDETKDEPAP